KGFGRNSLAPCAFSHRRVAAATHGDASPNFQPFCGWPQTAPPSSTGSTGAPHPREAPRSGPDNCSLRPKSVSSAPHSFLSRRGRRQSPHPSWQVQIRTPSRLQQRSMPSAPRRSTLPRPDRTLPQSVILRAVSALDCPSDAPETVLHPPPVHCNRPELRSSPRLCIGSNSRKGHTSSYSPSPFATRSPSASEKLAPTLVSPRATSRSQKNNCCPWRRQTYPVFPRIRPAHSQFPVPPSPPARA